ncbi:MAG: hypothetical protein IKZ96_00095 [Bacilli bacterium]|nr:hypothetical protein [Bacilli bacterium]
MKKVFIILGVLIICFVIAGCSSSTKEADELVGKNLSGEQLYQIYKEKGFKYIDLSMDNGVNNIVFENENIELSKFYNKYPDYNDYPSGTNYYFSNSDINNEKVNVNGEGNKKQYKAYIEWLKKEELSTDNVIDLLEYVEKNAWKDNWR